MISFKLSPNTVCIQHEKRCVHLPSVVAPKASRDQVDNVIDLNTTSPFPFFFKGKKKNSKLPGTINLVCMRQMRDVNWFLTCCPLVPSSSGVSICLTTGCQTAN